MPFADDVDDREPPPAPPRARLLAALVLLDAEEVETLAALAERLTADRRRSVRAFDDERPVRPFARRYIYPRGSP